MRKIIAVLLTVFLCFTLAYADDTQKAPDYVMEGYDGDSANHDWDTNLFFARRQEATGISFQFRQISDFGKWQSRKSEILAGKDLPDVLFKAELTVAETQQLYADGLIIDLKPYLEQYAPDLWNLLKTHPEWENAITLPDGSIPVLPNFNELQNNDALWINQNWLQTLKLDIPETADELTDVLRAFRTEDPNRNGKADEIPLTFIGMWELRFLGHAFGIIDNDYYVTAENGNVSTSLNKEENRMFLTWLHQLWQEDLLDHNGFMSVDATRQITDEKASIPYGAMLSVSPLTVVPSAALGQYTLLEPLAYNGKRIYRDLLGEVIRGTFAITKDCREPEKLVEWVNYLYAEEGNRLAVSGLEGEEYIWNEDGYWEWLEEASNVANYVLPSATISEGGSAPGLTAADFQLKYADRNTRTAITQLYALKQYAVLPYPYVTLTAEDAARIAELQAAIAPYAEETMACFVTGDTEINDENWNIFCNELERLGLTEMIGIWQKYVR